MNFTVQNRYSETNFPTIISWKKTFHTNIQSIEERNMTKCGWVIIPSRKIKQMKLRKIIKFSRGRKRKPKEVYTKKKMSLQWIENTLSRYGEKLRPVVAPLSERKKFYKISYTLESYNNNYSFGEEYLRRLTSRR